MNEICKNEPNLSLFSTTISSFLNQEIHRENLERGESDISDDDVDDDDEGLDSQRGDDDAHSQNENYNASKEIHNSVSQIKPPQIDSHHQNAQLSLVESFLSETSSRLNLENGDDLSMMSNESNDNVEKGQENYRMNENMCVGSNQHQSLVVSKGSKKWINTEINDTNEMSVNRDFLSKLIMSSGNNQCDENDDDDNSTILDVVETNQNQYNSPSIVIDTPDNMQQLQHLSVSPQIHHHQSNLVSGFYSASRQIGSISTSASMLVEAALNSVSNMIDNEGEIKNNSSSNSEENLSNLNINQTSSSVDHHMNHVEFENDRNYNQNSYIQSPIPNNLILKENNNDIDVDSVSTPNENFSHHATPSPRAISPGQDYPINMYSTSANTNHHMSLGNCRRNYSMMQDNHHIDGSESPQSLPRYDFSGIPRRKSDGTHQISQLSSDDENSIIVAQNLSINNNQNDMKVKMPHAQQLDILYSKYNNDGQSNLGHEDGVNNLGENRMKYGGAVGNNNEQNPMDISEFRSNSSNETISDFQGVDMSSRSLIGGNYQNSSSFQVPASGVNLSLNRYHHQIYDILSDRDQLQNDQHQLQQQQLQHMMQDQINDDQPDQSTSVDLSRSGNYSGELIRF